MRAGLVGVRPGRTGTRTDRGSHGGAERGKNMKPCLLRARDDSPRRRSVLKLRGCSVTVERTASERRNALSALIEWVRLATKS